MSPALTLQSDWIDADCNVQDTSQTLTTGSCWPVTTVYYPYPNWTTPSATIIHPPIRLSLREVERLRDVARSDSALKAILEKFTSQIEVIMSLE